MNTYRVKVGTKGEIVLPIELRELLGLVEGDTLALCIDSDGKVFVRTTERSVRPLCDFFEDLIVNDLLAKGCSGDCLKNKLLECKLKLSAILDRLSEEGYRAHKNGQAIKCWEAQALTSLGIQKVPKGTYDVRITSRGINDLVTLRKEELREIIAVFECLEKDPLAYKKLCGPYYETYRVSVRCGTKECRVVYTIFEPENLVVILTVGARKVIYERLSGIA